MIQCQKNKLWLEKISNLFCSFNLIPLDGMSLAEQMNSLTRLVIIVFIILLLLGFSHSLLFLLLSLLFIIILYYIQKKNMESFRTEYFTPEFSVYKNHIDAYKKSSSNQSSNRFCNDEQPLDGANGVFNNLNWKSENQKLVGNANPKTNISPVIAPPPTDMTSWRANNLVSHSAINQESQTDVYQSGYYVSPSNEQHQPQPQHQQQHQHQPQHQHHPQHQHQQQHHPQHQTKKLSQNDVLPYIKDISELGLINTSCGYNLDQYKNSGLPTNLPAGNCQQDSQMKVYNNNLFTQTIQPGVYNRNQINEPINSNIGISFTQQIPNTEKIVTDKDIKFMEYDPNIIEPFVTDNSEDVRYSITESNVYDPRFNGYGTSYRSYIDDKLGQPRFYYDDINAIRMPNYIVRSNIDNNHFADQYGPLPEGQEFGNKNTSNIQALANDAFLQSSLQHRTELQQRLMRPANNRQWQLRQAPISTSGGRMLGGIGSCK